MSHFTLYYSDLVELDAQRDRADNRQFAMTLVVIIVAMFCAYLVRF
jgi:hypothetical protein